MIKVPSSLCGNPDGDNKVIDRCIELAKEQSAENGTGVLVFEDGEYYYAGGPIEILKEPGNIMNRMNVYGLGEATKIKAVHQCGPVIHTNVRLEMSGLNIIGDSSSESEDNSGLYLNGEVVDVHNVTISGTSGPMIRSKNSILGTIEDCRLYRGENLMTEFMLLEDWVNGMKVDNIEFRDYLHSPCPTDIFRAENTPEPFNMSFSSFSNFKYEYTVLKDDKAFMRFASSGCSIQSPMVFDAGVENGSSAHGVVFEPAPFGGNYLWGSCPYSKMGDGYPVYINQSRNALSIVRPYCDWPDRGGAVYLAPGVEYTGGLIMGGFSGIPREGFPTVVDESGKETNDIRILGFGH